MDLRPCDLLGGTLIPAPEKCPMGDRPRCALVLDQQWEQPHL